MRPVFALFVSVPSLLLALYNGNPNFPQMPSEGFWMPEECWLSVKGGVEWDDTFNHYVELKKEWAEDSFPLQKFMTMRSSGVVTLGIFDRVEAYGTFGVMQTTIDQKTLDSQVLVFETDPQFVWSVGGRALIAYFGGFRFSLDAKYLESHPNIKRISLEGKSRLKDQGSLLLEEWQVGASVCYCWKGLSPYIGIKHTNVDATILGVDLPSDLFPKKAEEMKAEYDLGMFIGVGFAPQRGWNLNMEWRFIDEWGLTLSGDIRF